MGSTSWCDQVEIEEQLNLQVQLNQAMEEQQRLQSEIGERVEAREVAGGAGTSEERSRDPVAPGPAQEDQKGYSQQPPIPPVHREQDNEAQDAPPDRAGAVQHARRESSYDRDHSGGRGGGYHNRGRGNYHKKDNPWDTLRGSINKISDSAASQVDAVKNLTNPPAQQTPQYHGRLPVHSAIRATELRGKNCQHYNSTGSCTKGVICKERHDYQRCHNQVEDALRFDTIQGMVAVTNTMIEQINQTLCTLLKQHKQLAKEVEGLRRDIKNIGVTPSGIKMGRSSLKERGVDYTYEKNRSKSHQR